MTGAFAADKMDSGSGEPQEGGQTIFMNHDHPRSQTEKASLAEGSQINPMNREHPRPQGKTDWNDQEMEALQLAAQLILEHGGETFRAEETVRRMGEGFRLREVESFAVPSGLFISYRTAEGKLETSVRRVHKQDTDLTVVDQTNHISRAVAAGLTGPAEACRSLREIAALRREKNCWSFLLAAGVCAAGFTLLFQGGAREALVGALVAALTEGACMLFSRFHDSWIVSDIVGGFLTALLPALAARWLPGLGTEAVVAGALMPLVPGVAMTNAVQDGFRGDMVSGVSHGVSALMTAFMIAGGALLAQAVLRIVSEGGL